MALNRCEFIGNLGQDPEIRTFGNGDKVANLRLAVTEKWKDRDSGERREATEWISIAAFGPLAGIAEQYLRKGSKIFVAGKWKTRKWTDQQGVEKYSTEIVVGRFKGELTLLGGRGDGAGQGGGYGGGSGGRSNDDDYSSGFSTGGANKPSGPKESYDLNDDIPF